MYLSNRTAASLEQIKCQINFTSNESQKGRKLPATKNTLL
jgi:hypothetical protein